MKIKEEHADSGDEAVAAEYAKTARFKGAVLSLGVEGQKQVTAIITGKVDTKNVDRVAKCQNSNGPERTFGQVARITEGKRINVDMGDAYKVAAYQVAGVQSDADWDQNVAKMMGSAHSNEETKINRQKRKRKQAADSK